MQTVTCSYAVNAVAVVTVMRVLYTGTGKETCTRPVAGMGLQRKRLRTLRRQFSHKQSIRGYLGTLGRRWCPGSPDLHIQ